MDLKTLLFIVLGAGFLYGVSRLFGRKRRFLLKHGYSAEATVLTIERTGATINSSSTGIDKDVMEIDLQIKGDGEPDRIVTVRQTFETYMRPPEPGDKVKILVDPKNPDNVMLT